MKTNSTQRWLLNTFAAMTAAAASMVLPPAQAADDATQAAASTRTYWNALVARQQTGGFASKASTPPVINGVSVVTTAINPSTGVRAVKMTLNFSSAAGLSTVLIDVRSRDYHQGYRREFVVPYPQKSGPLTFETALLHSKNQPGYWDIRYIGVCDIFGQCASQDFYSLDPVASRQFSVTNSQTPDVGYPVINSAALTTTAVTTHSDGLARNVFLKFTLADPGTGGSGVVGVSVCARPTDESTEQCGYWETPAAIVGNTQQIVTIPFVGNTYLQDTWHIAVVEITDRAGNNLFINDPATLDAMFPNGRTFTVTNGS